MTVMKMSKLARRLSQLSVRDLLAVGIPVVILLVAGFWAAAQFVKPAPPSEIVMTTGGEGGAYQHYAARYKQFLADFGIRLIERPSAGSLENLARLLDPAQRVDAGLIQGGTGNDAAASRLLSLGSAYFEPLWVFYRGSHGLTRIDQLAGRRIAVGPEGSGTRRLSTDILEAHGLLAASTVLLPLSGIAAVEAMRNRQVDAVFVVGTAHSPAVWLLLHMDGVALMSMDQAEAYTRRFHFLSRLTLPHGAINFPRSIPSRDVSLVAPKAEVLVREDTHPALVDLLLQAMVSVHREPDLFQRADEFPIARHSAAPLHPRAERFYKSGAPFLQRYLPFWVANIIDRMMVLLLPVVALLIPLFKITPQIYAWRVRSRVYRWYGELKHLELQASTDLGSRSREEWLGELNRLDGAVNHTRAPLAYTDFVYTLRLHIDMVRHSILQRLDSQGAAAVAPAASSENRP